MSKYDMVFLSLTLDNSYYAKIFFVRDITMFECNVQYEIIIKNLKGIDLQGKFAKKKFIKSVSNFTYMFLIVELNYSGSSIIWKNGNSNSVY